MSDFMTVNEIGQALRCSRLTVIRRIKDKKLRAFKLPGGRSWRVRRSDFERFIGGASARQKSR